MSVISLAPPVEEADQHLVLYGIEWDQYVTINDALPDRRGLRMIYIDGSLTFLTLSRRHDWFVDYLDSIIKVVALGCSIEMVVAGSATFRVEGKKSGVEGDRTYYFGPNAELMSGPLHIDLSTQPPPDLAIEVEVTHATDKAVATYSRLRVPEVWRFDARRWTLAFLLLSEEGSYQSTPRSRNLPVLAPEDVLSQLKIAEETNSFTCWSAQLHEWVRVTLLPRVEKG